MGQNYFRHFKPAFFAIREFSWHKCVYPKKLERITNVSPVLAAVTSF